MLRFKNIVAAAGAAAIAAGLMSAPAQAQKYNFKLTSYVPLKSGTWINYQQRFIDAVHLLTNGEVKIKGYGVGVIAGPFDAWEAVQKGTADIAICYPGFAVNHDPANGIFGGMVGGMVGGIQCLQRHCLAAWRHGGIVWRHRRHCGGIVGGMAALLAALWRHRRHDLEL